MGYNFNIHPEIEKAETLPGLFIKMTKFLVI